MCVWCVCVHAPPVYNVITFINFINFITSASFMHKILQFGHEVIKYKGVDYYTVIVVVRLVQVELRHNTRVSAVYGSCNTLG